jgi:hypothetical protein
MKEKKEVMNTVKKRKLEYLGDIMKNETKYKLLKSILQGKVVGVRGPRKKKDITTQEPEDIVFRNNHRAVSCRDDGDGAE